MSTTSILIIGATGRTGLECLRELASHKSSPSIHAFVRNKAKLSDSDRSMCETIIEGDARSASDIEKAIRSSKATDVVVSVGNGDSTKQSDIRGANAAALASVLEKKQYRNVRVMLVSSNGAGESIIKVGMGIGWMISHHLRHVLHDHTNQENALASIRQRLTVVRPTSLTDDAPTGKVVTFGDKEKPPTIKTDRADVAKWIVNEICDNGHATMGQTVNITGVSK